MKTITLLFRDTCGGANRGAELELDYLHHGKRGRATQLSWSLGPVLSYGYYSNDFYLVGGSRHGGVCGSHRRRGRRLLEGVVSPIGARSGASSRITDVRRPVAIIDSHEAKNTTGASPASITARQFMQHSRD